jgi:hypothetical protein
MLDRIWLVYIVMVLIVACFFGCVFTEFSPGDTVHNFLCGSLMCAH